MSRSRALAAPNTLARCAAAAILNAAHSALRRRNLRRRSAEYRPFFQRARALRSSPSGVRGPVLRPPLHPAAALAANSGRLARVIQARSCAAPRCPRRVPCGVAVLQPAATRPAGRVGNPGQRRVRPDTHRITRHTPTTLRPTVIMAAGNRTTPSVEVHSSCTTSSASHSIGVTRWLRDRRAGGVRHDVGFDMSGGDAVGEPVERAGCPPLSEARTRHPERQCR
jgi:hypothetical protein